jgi:hypothetical protein
VQARSGVQPVGACLCYSRRPAGNACTQVCGMKPADNNFRCSTFEEPTHGPNSDGI